VEQPLVMWLWIGAGLVGLGSVLSAIPGRRRRRPTDPISAPVVESAPSLHRNGGTPVAAGPLAPEGGPDEADVPQPVGAGEPS
jgi:hypothetical protein